MNGNDQIKIKSTIKFELQLLLYIFLFLIVALLLIGNLSILKEILPVIVYAIPILLLMFIIGGYFNYKIKIKKIFAKIGF